MIWRVSFAHRLIALFVGIMLVIGLSSVTVMYGWVRYRLESLEAHHAAVAAGAADQSLDTAREGVRETQRDFILAVLVMSVVALTATIGLTIVGVRITVAPVRAAARRLLAHAGIGDDGGGSAHAGGNPGDVTHALLRASARLDAAERRRGTAESAVRMVERAFEAAAEGMVIFGPAGRVLRINAAVERGLGVRREEIVGAGPAQWSPSIVATSAIAPVMRAIRERGSWSGEVVLRRGDGDGVPYRTAVECIADERGRPEAYVAVITDLRPEKQATERLHYLATHDSLTGLPNRAALEDSLDQSLARARRGGPPVAVAFVDLDDFKLINDSYGHSAGDEFLRQVAMRLSSTTRGGDTVARFGGDEFVVVFEPVENEQALVQTVRRLLDRLFEPIVVMGRVLQVSASVGIATFPESGTRAGELIRNADTAMYQAKQTGKRRYSFHDPEVNTNALRRLTTEQELMTAFSDDQLEAYFQPIMATEDRGLVGAEALVRWRRNGLIVSPDEFLPLVRGSDVLHRLSLVMIEASVRFLQANADVAPDDFFISVNVTPVELNRDGYVEEVLALLDRNGCPTESIRLEVTESILASDISRVKRTIGSFRRNGVAFLVDDFGTGCSSLQYLRDLESVATKLDRSYLLRLNGDARRRELVRGFVELIHGIGQDAIVEGVETENQLEFVTEIGADYVQGFFVGGPMPADKFRQAHFTAGGSLQN